MKHGITEKMLVDQPSFSIVFRRFLDWIDQCIKEACGSNEFHYYPGKLLQGTVRVGVEKVTSNITSYLQEK